MAWVAQHGFPSEQGYLCFPVLAPAGSANDEQEDAWMRACPDRVNVCADLVLTLVGEMEQQPR